MHRSMYAPVSLDVMDANIINFALMSRRQTDSSALAEWVCACFILRNKPEKFLNVRIRTLFLPLKRAAFISPNSNPVKHWIITIAQCQMSYSTWQQIPPSFQYVNTHKYLFGSARFDRGAAFKEGQATTIPRTDEKITSTYFHFIICYRQIFRLLNPVWPMLKMHRAGVTN